MSTNHVERHVLACGFSVERIRNDYGFDLFLFLYDRWGHVKPGRVSLQLKATDRIELRDAATTVACGIDLRDLRLWLETPEPVVLILYDAAKDRAFWLYVQSHFAGDVGRRALAQAGSTITVRIPMTHRVGPAAIRTFEKFSDALRGQQRDIIRYHE